MNKGKFTFLEVLSIIIIIVLIIIISYPLIIKGMDEFKKREYIDNTNTYIDRAVDMYTNNENSNKFTKNGDNYTIKLIDIDGVNIKTDPYGYIYDLENSTIVFNQKTKDVIVNIKSCITKNQVRQCYEIADVSAKDLDTNSIKTSMN